MTNKLPFRVVTGYKAGSSKGVPVFKPSGQTLVDKFRGGKSSSRRVKRKKKYA